MALYYLPQYKTTSLATVGGINSSTTSGIKLADTTNVDTTKPGIICVDYANPLDTDTAEFITYTSIDGTGTLVGPTRGQEGITAKEHSFGAVVAFVVSKSHINLINDLLTGVTEGIKVKTSLQDANGNEVIKMPATASAVNELTITNAATGNAPEISSTGDDTNIDLKIKPKGTGKLKFLENGTDPYRTIVIPAGSMSPTTTAGCASSTTVEAGTNDVDYKVLDFDTSTVESAWVLFQMPNNWDGGTITFKPVWTAASGSGTVCFGLKGRAYADDDAIDQAYGTEQTSTDTLITAGDVHIGPESSAITLAGTPAGGQLVQLKITRQTGSDTLGVDARLIGIRILYKISQYSD